MLDARSFMISTLRSQVGFTAAIAHARLRLSRLELIGGSGRTAGRYASAARLHFADCLRAGAGRRSGSGWRQGRVRWGRPLLSRPRGAVGSGPAAVESAAVSAIALTCRLCVLVNLDGCEVRRCDPCALVRLRVCVCPGKPPVSFYRD
jgi:hypothetical protein